MSNDYVLLGPEWNASQTITWSFATSNYANSASQFASYMAPTSTFAQEVEQAFARWAQVSGLKIVEATDSSAVDIRVGFAPIDGPYNIVATTNYQSSGGIFDPGVTIRFDSDETYTSGSNPLLANTGGISFESIALHEIGHTLGLDHYNLAPAIMNANPSPAVQDLTQSDIDGIHAVYSPSSLAPSPIISSLGAAAADTVDQAYENVLQRHATTQEVSASLTMSQTALQTAVINSAEAVQYVDPVVRLYQAAFDRVPDQAGLAFNVNALHSESLQDLAQGFVSSSEFTKEYGSATVSDGLVKALYENVLGREGSATEISYWSHSGASAAQIIVGFSESSEFKILSSPWVNSFLSAAAQGAESYTGSLAQNNSTFDEDHLTVPVVGSLPITSSAHLS